MKRAAGEISATSTGRETPWLFSPSIDLCAFGGSALVALTLVAIGWMLGFLDQDSPEWTWVTAILLVDVAHVYATGFRVYFDPTEFRRRAWLYTLVPVISFAIAWAAYSENEMAFWRLLAYLAVFHFIRQQYGWVAMYRSRAGERDRFGWWVDSAAIYLATIYPLIHWHGHLPRQFWWFIENDFQVIPQMVATVLQPVYWLVMVVYFARSLYSGLVRQRWNPGKDLVVFTTAVCWYLGIITLNSDYAFTVTNVIIHGIPYMVLVFWIFGRQQKRAKRFGWFRLLVVFLASIWVLAYIEELLWDRSLWMERSWLFGTIRVPESLHVLVVPMLAVPQLSHYILDGFIWRRKSNPHLSEAFRRNSPSSSA